MNRLLSALALILLFFSALPAGAEVPQVISYQGRLDDSLGNPIPGGSYEMVFSIYGVPEGGGALWTSGPQMITVNNGVFEYSLGSNVSFPASFFNTDTLRFLGISVDGGDEMTPRVRFKTVAYAYMALECDTAGYALSVGPNSVNSSNITDGSIDFVDIGQNGAGPDQVMKWNGSAWAAADDEAGSNTSGWIDSSTVVKLDNIDDKVGIGTRASSMSLHRFPKPNSGRAMRR